MTQSQDALKKIQDTQAQITSLTNRMNNANVVLNADPQKWSTTILSFEGNQISRQNLQNFATSLEGQVSTLTASIPSLQKIYDDAIKAETAANAAAFNIANPNAAVQIEQAKIAGATKAFIAQSTTKYLIWGAIALVVVVIGIIIYKKKFAKG
jgi:hypothetical protein